MAAFSGKKTPQGLDLFKTEHPDLNLAGKILTSISIQKTSRVKAKKIYCLILLLIRQTPYQKSTIV